MLHLIVAITGASGTLTAKQLVEKSPWPVTLIVSKWGNEVYQRETGHLDELKKKAHQVFDNGDLSAPVSSGSVQTAGMVIIPCSCNTLGEIASGINNTLISRAAHCHLKERRKLILCIRESPLSLIEMENGARIIRAGGVIMPISPPFYMLKNADPEKTTWQEVMDAYVDRVLSILGDTNHLTWENIQ